MKNLYQKLSEVRVDLQDLGLKKTGKNQTISYYELGDFLPAVNALCNKKGLFTRFNIINDRRTEKAVLTVFNSEKPEEKVSFVSPTADVELPRGQKIQGLGAKITYMRRYMLMMAFEIVESDIVDSINKELAGDLPQEEIDKINATKTFKELTTVCGKLKEKYKVEVINPFFESKKVDLEQNTEPVIKVGEQLLNKENN